MKSSLFVRFFVLAGVALLSNLEAAVRPDAVVAWRNEQANVSVPLSAAEAGAAFSVGDFVSPHGSRIPAAAARVLVTSPAGGAAQALVSVDVPSDASPDVYEGRLTGGDSSAVIVIDVRHDVLADVREWAFFGPDAESVTSAVAAPDVSSPSAVAALGAYALAQKLDRASRLALLKSCGMTGTLDGFSAWVAEKGVAPEEAVRRAALCDALETYEKASVLQRTHRATWRVSRALKPFDVAFLQQASVSNRCSELQALESVFAAHAAPGYLNGRKVDSVTKTYGSAFGYAAPVETAYLVQHPTAEKERPGRPLLVVLHSAGHNAEVALDCTRAPGNHDIYRSPDDFYALFLDCKRVSGDWWYGSENGRSFALSPCERRMLADIEEIVVKYGIDRDRIYLCGNSMGGSGTLGFGLRHGDVFAAVKANVPAHVDHALARLGAEPATSAADCATIPDPPLLIDYSGTDDKWFTGHERLVRVMKDRRYPWQLFWGRHGHCNRDSIMLAKNDLIHSYPWLEVRKGDLLPAFTACSSDTACPLPLASPKDAPEAPGQINAFLRWGNSSKASGRLETDLFLAPLKSRHFDTPASVTADVTLRRTAPFVAVPGERLAWSYGDRRGELTVGADGRVTLEKLEIVPEARRLSVWRFSAGGSPERR